MLYKFKYLGPKIPHLHLEVLVGDFKLPNTEWDFPVETNRKIGEYLSRLFGTHNRNSFLIFPGLCKNVEIDATHRNLREAATSI